MSEEPSAISRVAPAPAAQSDYDAICAALMDTGRGRWFLQEYARRNRSAETQLLLAAIQRIEAVICAERDRQAQQGFRNDLLEMAQAITRTRAEVAEIRSEAPSRPQSVPPESQASPRAAPARGVFAAAERIRDVAWAMRGHGFDPSTCEQLEELAASILSASSLCDPGDRRASKLSEVLQYLEHRIDALLEGGADAAAAPETAPLPAEAVAAAPEPALPAIKLGECDGERSLASSAAIGPDQPPSQAAEFLSPTLSQPATADAHAAQAEETTPAQPAASLAARLPADAHPAQSAPPMPPAFAADSLAALEAMSEDELIALFS